MLAWPSGDKHPWLSVEVGLRFDVDETCGPGKLARRITLIVTMFQKQQAARFEADRCLRDHYSNIVQPICATGQGGSGFRRELGQVRIL